MPILQHLCAGDFLRAFEQERVTNLDVLDEGKVRYHNYLEGYVTDSKDNLLMFVVNVNTRDKPEWLEARFSAKSNALGMSYRLVPIQDQRRPETPVRKLDCVEVSDGED
jgi:hypothetical protein